MRIGSVFLEFEGIPHDGTAKCRDGEQQDQPIPCRCEPLGKTQSCSRKKLLMKTVGLLLFFGSFNSIVEFHRKLPMLSHLRRLCHSHYSDGSRIGVESTPGPVRHIHFWKLHHPLLCSSSNVLQQQDSTREEYRSPSFHHHRQCLPHNSNHKKESRYY